MIDSQGDRSRGILVLMTVPLAWGTFEPVVRFVYQIDFPGLVFSPCYYFVAAVALSTLSFITSLSKSPPTNTLLVEESAKTASFVPLSVWGGMELGFYLFLGNSLQVLGLKTLNSDRVAFLIQLTTVRGRCVFYVCRRCSPEFHVFFFGPCQLSSISWFVVRHLLL